MSAGNVKVAAAAKKARPSLAERSTVSYLTVTSWPRIGLHSATVNMSGTPSRAEVLPTNRYGGSTSSMVPVAVAAALSR